MPGISEVLEQEFLWFLSFVGYRGKNYKSDDKVPNYVHPQIYIELPVPELDRRTPYGQLILDLQEYTPSNLSEEELRAWKTCERMTLLIALIPPTAPHLLIYFQEFEKISGHSLNSLQGVQSGYFLPSAETILFLLAGRNLALRLLLQKIFHPSHFFYQHDILSLEGTPKGVPHWRGSIHLSPEYLHLITSGESYEPEMSPDFPAHRLATDQSWQDLVVPMDTHIKIQELLEWIQYYDKLMLHEDFAKERKGYRCLIVGEPGTGKTMLGRLLSRETDRPVYRLSLDKIVSKYVGETTKNIAKVFRVARNRDWILFCDEGDALFSKRSTKVSSAQDTFVNQDIAYLLQEIEDYPGIILVATNYSANLDKAFMRRFDTRIDFRKPDYSEIITLWENALKPFELKDEIDLNFVAKEQMSKVTGAQIAKVKHYLGIQALRKSEWSLTLEDFIEGLKQNAVPIPDFEGLKERISAYNAIHKKE